MKQQTTIMGMMIAGMTIINTATTHADSFGSGVNQFNIDCVAVGNPGNSNDSGAGGGIYSSPYGGVSYDYRIGKYEVSQNSINMAVAEGLTGMPVGSWTGDQPSTGINWFKAAAFTNWLNTSTGHQLAYQLNETMTALTMWASADAWQEGGENLYRHKDAHYFMPSENEWYKAAYHKNDGVTSNYWDYATNSNSIPTAVGSGALSNTAVYHGLTTTPADVSNAGGLSAYGTMEQCGNAWEWLESANDGVNNSSGEYRAFRGGFWNSTEPYLRSSSRNYNYPTVADGTVGFRVASVPEPSSVLLLISATAFTLSRRIRSKFNKQ